MRTGAGVGPFRAVVGFVSHGEVLTAPHYLRQHHGLRRGHGLLLGPLLHVQTAGDELAKAGLVGKSVARPHGPRAPPHGRLAVDVHVAAKPGLGLPHPLAQSHPVGQGGLDVGFVEAEGDHGQDEHGTGQQQAEPEFGLSKHLEGNAGILVADGVRVEGQVEAEEVDDAAPYDKMVEASPVAGVQGTLKDRLSLYCVMRCK